jgi:hypothetical protein
MWSGRWVLRFRMSWSPIVFMGPFRSRISVLAHGVIHKRMLTIRKPVCGTHWLGYRVWVGSMHVPLRSANNLAATLVYDVKPMTTWVAFVPRKLARKAILWGGPLSYLKNAIEWIAVCLMLNFHNRFELIVGYNVTEFQRHDLQLFDK